MIVYFYDEKFLSKTILPTTINGVYPLFNEEQKFLANIEEKDGKWIIKENETSNIYINSEKYNEVTLSIYFKARIMSISSGHSYFLFCSPIYDTNIFDITTNKNVITIGKESSCDITFKDDSFVMENITLTLQPNRFWKLETKNDFLFINGVCNNNKLLFFGDSIFFHGLHFFIIGNRFIVNNPNNQILINSTSFVLTLQEPPQTNITVSHTVAEDAPVYSKEEYFFKSPRFTSVTKEEKVVIDEPPPEIVQNETSMILTIGPQLTMVCTSALTMFSYVTNFLEGNADPTRFTISMATIVITIVGALLWPTLTNILNRRRVKKLEQKRCQKYRDYLVEKKNKIYILKEQERQVLIENNVPLSECQKIIASRSRNLWSRLIEHEDFLNVKLGTGMTPSHIIIEEPSDKFTIQEKDELLVELERTVVTAKYIENAPLCVNLTEKYITGIVGSDLMCHKFMDSLFLQIMTFQSYSELKIVVFTSEKSKNNWSYLKISPHIWNNSKTLRYFATTMEEMNIISSDLEKVFENRLSKSEEEILEDNGEKENNQKPLFQGFRPYYLIFTDDILTIRNVPIIKKILNYKQNVGFSLLMLNDKLSTFPNETFSFISIGNPKSALMGNELTIGSQMEFDAQLNDVIDMHDCVSMLANIPIQLEKAKYELPSSLSFLEMYQVGRVEQLNSLDRWKNNNPVNSLSVPVGIDQNGEIFKMDLHEKMFGPHGLVAGTTGSGKSEWIVTLILSLAVNFNPDEVQFVIIDYKGGGLAMSFENQELGIKLPHLAGTITNLDKSEINRSIASIESELKRRQSIFNEAREKLKESSMNIYKYQQFYRKGMVDIPLSHLLIISDEFAELKQQQPEFMEQLISTSRIGRSLGVHLILATQKPSGVVNDQIWSNSRFKVCLRVQDVGDSNEILKKPDAAYLKQTGAFYLEVGNDEYYNLGQSAWAGAKYYPSDILKKKIDESVQNIDNIGRITSYYDESLTKDIPRESHGEELLNVISYLDKISKNENFRCQQLWLPNVSSTIYLSDLNQKYHHQREAWNFNTVIGEYDEPRRQEQNILKVDLVKGNIAIFGQSGAGKEKLITTLMWSSMTEHTPNEINYYVLDYGAETMKMFSKFPHVGEVVFQDETEKVAGVLDLILEELAKRKELFMDYNGSYDFYIHNSGKTLPLIVLVINAFDVFSEALPKLSDIITSLFRDAPRYGIVFVTSVSSSNGLRTRQLQYFNHLIVLQMNDDSIYRNLTNCRRGLLPKKTIGRGICKTSDTVDSYCEFQTAFITDEKNLVMTIRQTADYLSTYYTTKAKQLTVIPENVQSKDLIKYITDLSSVPIGFNFYEKDVAKYNFLANKIHLISTKDLANNMNFIYALTSLLSKIPNTKVRVVDMLGIFTRPILDIKLFNEKLDVVMAALEKDAKERSEIQDYGITLLLGVGSFKKVLSAAGTEIAESMFSLISNSKKSIYIFVDNYEKLRILKLESWFNKVDTTNGLWLGQGLSSQSMFLVEDISSDDRKYDFEGMAYHIEDSKYTLIKTMMDSEE